MNHTLTGIQAAFNASQQGLGLASDLANMFDQKLRENAEIQARNAQLQYEQDAAAFLKDLENSNDFGNWESKANDFLTQYSNKLQASAKNGYTAKLLDMQMKNNSKTMSINVMNAANNGMRKESIVEYGKNLELINQNYQGQERLDLVMQNLNEQYQKGLIDRATYEKTARSQCMGASIDHLTTQSNDIVANAIKNGNDLYELTAELDKMSDADLLYFTMKSISGSEGADIVNGGEQKLTKEERAEIKAKVIEQAKQNYELQVKQMQDNSHGQLAQIYFDCNDYPTGSVEREALKTKGRALMDRLYADNKLNMSNGDIVTFSDRFRPDKDKGTTSGSGSGGSGGSGSRSKPKSGKIPTAPYHSEEWNKEKYFADSGIAKCITDDIEIARNSESKYTMYNLIDASYARLQEFAQRDGLTKEQADELYETAYQYAVSTALSKFKEANPRLENAINRVETLTKNMPKELQADATKRIYDICFDMNLNNLDPEKAAKEIADVEAIIQTGKIQIMKRDKDLKGSMKAKDAGKALWEISQTHLIQSDQQGRLFFVPGLEENTPTLDAGITAELSKITGLPASSFTGSWERDNKHDFTQLRMYQTEDGTAYRIVPLNKNGDYKVEVSVMPGKWATLSGAGNKKERATQERAEKQTSQKEAQEKVKETVEQERITRAGLTSSSNTAFQQAAEDTRKYTLISQSFNDLPDLLRSRLVQAHINTDTWAKANSKTREYYLFKLSDYVTEAANSVDISMLENKIKDLHEKERR